MFHSFFPKPKLFFLSAILWAAVAGAAWIFFFHDMGSSLSLGNLLGYGFPTPPPEGADERALAVYEGARSFAAESSRSLE